MQKLGAIGTKNRSKRTERSRLASVSEGPWKAWRVRTRHGRAIKFIETFCRAAKGKGHGQPLKLAAFQKEWLEAVLADGTDIGVLQTPRGQGKSTLGGALALWATFDDDQAESLNTAGRLLPSGFDPHLRHN